MSSRPALLITPKTIWLKKKDCFLRLDSLKDLTSLKLTEVDVFIDGFQQEFNQGSLPSIGLFDRRSAVFHKLSRVFQKAIFFGGSFSKQKNKLNYRGFGFESTTKLHLSLQELIQLKLKVRSIRSLVFSAAPALLSHFLKQEGGESVLWISPFVNEGLRLVFYQQQEIMFVRTIPYTLKDLGAYKDLMQTLGYIQNEYSIDFNKLKVLITTGDEEESETLKHLSSSRAIVRWGHQHLKKVQHFKSAVKNDLLEAWLVPYGQAQKSFFNFMSKSPLMPMIRKTRRLKAIGHLLQGLSIAVFAFTSMGAYDLWKLKSRLHIVKAESMQSREKVDQLWTQLKLPQDYDWAKFYRFLVQQQAAVEDPLKVLSALADPLKPDFLIQEFFWRSGLKSELKLSLRFLSSSGNDKNAAIEEFKTKLSDSMKQKEMGAVTIGQPSLQIMEVSWP